MLGAHLFELLAQFLEMGFSLLIVQDQKITASE